MPTRSRVVDRRRPEVNRSPDNRRAGSRGDGDAVALAIDDGAGNGRPPNRVETRMVKTKDIALTHSDVLLRVEVDVDVAQLRRVHESL